MPRGPRLIQTPHHARHVTAALVAAVVALAIVSLLIGPAQFAPSRVFAALLSDQGAATVIVRDIRLPRTLLALVIGATFGLSGAALQGLLRNPLAEPGLFGAPQAAAAAAASIMAFGIAPALSPLVPLAGIAYGLLIIAGFANFRTPAFLQQAADYIAARFERLKTA